MLPRWLESIIREINQYLRHLAHRLLLHLSNAFLQINRLSHAHRQQRDRVRHFNANPRAGRGNKKPSKRYVGNAADGQKDGLHLQPAQSVRNATTSTVEENATSCDHENQPE